MSSRTSIVLDEESRRAARELALRYDCSMSEAIRRAIVRQRDLVMGTPNRRDFAGIPDLRLSERRPK